MALSVGDVLDGKYRVVRLIGEGGMGTVYEGEHIRIRRRVAIKALLPSVATEEAVERFQREAQAAGQIGNEHILEVLDLGTLASGEHYMVMEFLYGETLAQRIQSRGRLTAEELAPLAQQVLTGLTAAHEAGIIHRDLKPENIFILPEKAGHRDFVKLIDFGISKFTQTAPESLKVTRIGSLLGTPFYMSPELCRGTPADARTDIYGIGVIMYEALSGRLPFDSDTFNDLLLKIVTEPPLPLEEVLPDLDPDFANIIARAMAKDPAARFQTARELSLALKDWMLDRGIAPPATTSSPSFSNVRSSSSDLAPAASRTPAERRERVSGQPATARITPKRSTPLVTSATGSGARVFTATQTDAVQPNAAGTKKTSAAGIARMAAAGVALVLLVTFLVRLSARSTTTPTSSSTTTSVDPAAAAEKGATPLSRAAASAPPPAVEPPHPATVASAPLVANTIPTAPPTPSSKLAPAVPAVPRAGAAGHVAPRASASTTPQAPTTPATPAKSEPVDEIPTVR